MQNRLIHSLSQSILDLTRKIVNLLMISNPVLRMQRSAALVAPCAAAVVTGPLPSALGRGGRGRAHIMAAIAFEIHHTTGRGRCAHAASDLCGSGTVLLEELPLCSMRLPDSGSGLALPACEHCLAPRGHISEHLRILAGMPPPAPPLPLDPSDDLLTPAEVRCRYGCGAAYCGAGCEARAVAAGHAYLCPTQAAAAAVAAAGGGTVPRCHYSHRRRRRRRRRLSPRGRVAALSRFRAHALRHYEGFLFGAKMVVGVLARFDAAHGVCASAGAASSSASSSTSCWCACLRGARAPLDGFCRAPWWTLCDEQEIEAAGGEQGLRQGAAPALPRRSV
eukprot:COSAG01_NODE_3939_length_5514_cov_662.486057_8_plen_335_part_00